MIRKADQYFSATRILMLIIGLWPYHQSIFTTFQYIFISVILTTFVVFQLTTFLTLKCTTEHLVKVLSSISLDTIFIIKYYVFHFYIDDMKDLLVQLQHVHNELKDKNEIAIMKKYDYIANYHTVILIIFGICVLFANIILQFWINMIDVDLPMNVSQPYQFVFTMEYFIDQETYFYLIILHINATVCIGTIIIIGSGTMLITYMYHTCGMFRIASYRIEHAINTNFRRNINFENKITMTEDTICAVDIHRQAIKLTKHLMTVMEFMMLCLIACCVICVSLNLFQIALSKRVENFLVPLGCASVCIMYMFFCNLQGQIVTDHYNHIFTAAYNVQWYKTPLHMQRMILFLLQIGIKEYYLNVGGVFDASIEGFAMLVKASISYFTVIYSTQ
ncbi:PREDICTED: uncharacterized protein LOC105559673 isoform X2 [Vollenhovia emeryi]|uniref:uncharacterized protein LOC105559673 isoform X2 n=1 Tax=Vollenhovia emeryi TaxID=411798 RepID=UPI0005F55C7E|nr:PREDICTED: uncharacterized protein LOC105559673 isoform X2 [Vollenhovia emeryi]